MISLNFPSTFTFSPFFSHKDVKGNKKDKNYNPSSAAKTYDNLFNFPCGVFKHIAGIVIRICVLLQGMLRNHRQHLEDLGGKLEKSWMLHLLLISPPLLAMF